LLSFIIAFYLSAADTYHEKDYAAAWCAREGGITEYVLPDKTRVDCLLPGYAVEFDYGKKWAESIGQALYYGLMTHRAPGVVLIVTDPMKEFQFIARLRAVADIYGIRVWVIGDEIFQIN